MPKSWPKIFEIWALRQQRPTVVERNYSAVFGGSGVRVRVLAPFLPRVLTIRPALENFEGDFLTKVVWPTMINFAEAHCT